ncbi:MAG: ATP-dependent Clp protease adaptor protein ClpS [Hyphomicrobiaceae bacterium]
MTPIVGAFLVRTALRITNVQLKPRSRVDADETSIRMNHMSDQRSLTHRKEGELLTKQRPKIKKPPMYVVVILNDDYTPMEFVIWILQTVFYKNSAEASKLMLAVHNDGRGVCGIFTHDIARTKSVQVSQMARKHEHPLECIIEPCDSGDEDGDG